MDNNLTRLIKGLFRDSSPQDQPKESYRFGLNGIMETDQGDNNFVSNEESNEICGALTPGYIPIGKVYAGNDRTIIFSVSADDSISEIGIYYANNCEYTAFVNDANSSEKDKLGFSIQYQIQATYRLRRGCEDTVYWTDNNKRPRYFNFHKPTQFQRNNGTWVSSKFNLQRTYDLIPNFESVEVLDSGGNLEPGSYNFAIQYVDESLNPTEWISTSPIIRIYNDISTKEYGEITGSINSEADYLSFPTTGKSIKIKLNNLDNNFLYYRLAVITANNGSGLVNNVFYTETIPTTKDFFIYTGKNHVEQGTSEEILQFSNVIEKAQSIEQIENRLILAGTQGTQADLCKLQKFASRIRTDCITKKVVLNDINDPANTKNPSHEFNNGLGYMPGEIYSFGIVYIFEDNSLSPVYHIPGKDEGDEGSVFSPSFDTDGNPIVFPMATNNKGASVYTNNSTCNSSDFWGLDYNGVPLGSKPIRHHRFPLRSQINVPLVNNSFGENQSSKYYNLRIEIKGNLKVPVPCPEDKPGCGSDQTTPFNIRVEYKVNGEDFFFIETINPSEYSNGVDESFDLDIYQNSNYHGSDDFSEIKIFVSNINDVYQNFGEWAEADGTEQCQAFPEYLVRGDLCIKPTSEEYISTTQSKIVTSNILGVKFSGIDKPPLEETNGLEVIGYYIVRNERTEFEKTIIDSAVMFPTVVNNKYIAHGLLQPETNNLSPSVFGFLHPEHKFNQKEYVVYDNLIQEGNYEVLDRKLGKINYDDVYDGSSYDSKYHKGGNDDGHETDGSPTSRGFDGWSFNLISRDNIVNFKTKNTFNFDKSQLKERFYLDALGHKSVNDNKDDVYNIACDNKIGIVQLEDGVSIPSGNNLPYVVMYKENLDPYANFRILPYYKETQNPVYFNNTNTSERSVFNGDSYVSPMRYTNTMYWDNRVADRQGRKSILKIILGAVLVVVGAVLAFFTAGATTVVVGAGIALIGAGALFVSSGIKIDNYNRAYGEEYEKGLRQTALDSWTDMFYNYRNTIPFGFEGNGGSGGSGPSDDTIQWMNECVTDLWFESSINMNLRNGFVDDLTPTFLRSPWRVETGNDSKIGTWNFFDKNYTNSNAQRYPVSTLESHGARKLLAFDDTRDDNRFYIGLALGEYYNVNPDYDRRNTQKIYYHLPLEYDCCSDCREDFPHRIHYSEQSYQEELSDNFRIFLPNNYKDIEGEAGKITNLYRLGMDLFVHTEEALWQVPRNYQERITDQIVSFIGTGEYFAVPPRKIIDDDTGHSAGCTHKWGSIKTPVGIFFPSENQNKLYQFDGKGLKAISNKGLNNWFKNNIEFQMDKDYFKTKKIDYPFRDNPSNPFGTGFISTYDSRKERILFTKKDFLYEIDFPNDDFELCTRNGELISFPNISQTIQAQENLGWSYVGLENCRMKFQRDVVKTREEVRKVKTTINIPNATDIHVFFDTSGSFGNMGGACLQSIDQAINNWVANFGADNPEWSGNVYKYQDTTERWLAYANTIATTTYGGNTADKDVIVISFCNEAAPRYHNDLTDPMSEPTQEYMDDYNNFVNNVYPSYNSFIGIHYPIVFGKEAGTCGSSGGGEIPSSKAFLQHSIAALWGVTMTNAEVSAELSSQNGGFTTQEWNGMINTLQTYNPYPDNGLKNFGWVGKWDRFANSAGVVINDIQFQEDISELLEGFSEEIWEDVIVQVEYIETEYLYIDGEVLEDLEILNNSWTMSYSLKNESWLFWHSYLPNFYINIPDDFFSWIHGSSNFWKHNKLGHYQTFYGKHHPFIVEFVSLSNPLTTRIWDYIKLVTEAKRYNEDFNEFVDERFITFNKGLFYNSRQSSGILNFLVKDVNPDNEDYLLQQVQNLDGDSIIIDRNERDWHINQLRDIRTDYSQPIFRSKLKDLQEDYYIDKIVNEDAIDYNKDWTELESFRDKYLVVRLIFDNFDDIKLLLNYSVENEVQSFR